MSTYDYDDIRRSQEIEVPEQTPVTTEGFVDPSTVEQPAVPEGTTKSRKQIREETKDIETIKDERGPITEVGEFLNYLLTGDGLSSDALNALAAGVDNITPEDAAYKELTQKADEFFKGSQELKDIRERRAEDLAQKSEDGELSLTNQYLYRAETTAEGIATGMEAGLAMPFTAAGKVFRQDTPWSRAPATLKNSPDGKAAFNIAEILLPTLIFSGVGGPAALGPGALLGESAIETSVSDGADDTLTARAIAVEMGVIAQGYGYDGEALTAELLRGETTRSRAFNYSISFLENLGINFGVQKLFQQMAKGRGETKPPITEQAEEVAEVLNKSPQKTQSQLDDVSEPVYRADAEPTDVITIETGSNKPTKGYISEPAEVAEAMRKSGIAEDGLTSSDRKFFTNWAAISDDTGIQRTIKEATSTLKKLKEFPEDFSSAMLRAEKWWEVNKELLDSNINLAAGNFQKDMVTLTKKGESVADLMDDFWSNGDKYLKEYSVVTEEGFIAAALVGEELGVKLQKLARQAVNLENANRPIDFTNIVEQTIEMTDKLNLFMTPLRRGKRKWAVEGMSQQRKSIEKVKDADVVGTIRERQPLSVDAPSSEFEKINFNETDPGSSLRELWDRYKAGDEAAGKYLKDYLSVIAYVDPRSVVGAVDNLSKVVGEQLAKTNLEATQALYYQFLLTRLRPQVASAGSNIARLVLEPFGAMLSGEFSYGAGQFIGGLTAMGDALSVFATTFKEGQALNKGTKFDHIEATKAAFANEEALYKNVREQLARDGAPEMDRYAAYVNHLRRLLAFHPASNVATRGLTAGDEASKVVFGSQVATGRAFKFASQTGTWGDIRRIINVEMNNAFKDGVRTNKIVDADILSGAKTLTFQQDIPLKGNAVDNLFLSAEAATDKSGIFRFFNPFPRLSYNVLEQSGRVLFQEALLGARFRGKTYGGFDRYRRIMAGEEGDVAQLQLKSQFALGKALALTGVGFAWNGLMTGANSGNLPRQSFIIPWEGSKDGYIAISYAKIEPYATVLTVISDLTNALRNDEVTAGQYDKMLGGLIYSLGVASTDKSFQQGMINMGQLLSVKNFQHESSLGSLAQVIGTGTASQFTGAPGGVLRMTLDNFQPYRVNTQDADNPTMTILNEIRRRLTGGIGLPPQVDEITGKPIPKVATAGKGDNYWAAVGASWSKELIFPGDIKDAPVSNKVKRELNAIGYTLSDQARTRYKGVALTPDQQTEFSRAQFEAGLPEALTSLFDSDEYKSLKQRFEAARKQRPLGDTSEGTVPDQLRDEMIRMVDARWDMVREDAARISILADENSDFSRKYMTEKFGLQSSVQTQVQEDIQGLLTMPV